jgi:hypothetical protein
MVAIDMEMPKSCAECLFMSYSECLLNDEYIMDTAERDNDCPLKEIREAKNMAIKALEQEGYYKDLAQSYEKTIVKLTEAIAEPIQRWIPVSERLPEENGFYLATCDGEICGENEPFTGLAEYENGKWVDDEEDYQCVLAWMPLPEPYKAESEDKDAGSN